MGEQGAIGDIGDLVAALGLVHVVGGDQHGEPLRRQRMDLVPEVAPRLGIDARRGLVQQQEIRLGQDAGAQRQPLLPAPRKLPRQLILAARKAKPRDGLAGGCARIGHAIDAPDKFEILADGEVLIKREALGHVAHPPLDEMALGEDVVAQTSPAAAVGGQQAAEHADGRGLARTIGAEKPVDLPAPHLQGEILHHHARAERLGQPRHVDDDVGRRLPHGASSTVTGWPTRSSCGLSGRASIL